MTKEEVTVDLIIIALMWVPYFIFGGDMLLGGSIALTAHKLMFG